MKKKSNLSQAERDLIDLSTGKKKPTTKADKKMLEDIKKIKNKGGSLHIPND